jgi:hypothetical protein
VSLATKLAREVTGSCGHVEHRAARSEAKVSDRATTPARVQTEGHHSIDKLIARGDRVKHRANVFGLLVTLGEGCHHRQKYNRERVWATQAGFSEPLISTTTSMAICTPPATSSTEASVAPARTSEPTGTGDVNRTLFDP